MKTSLFLFCLLFICSAFKSFSSYNYDNIKYLPVDTNILGIWKSEDDTNSKNYFFIQQQSDVNNRYVTKSDSSVYYITYMNYNGTNPVYLNYPFYLAKNNDTLFAFENKKDRENNCKNNAVEKIAQVFIVDKNTIKISSISDRLRRPIHNKNIENATLHKISNIHSDTRTSIEEANK